MKLLRPALAHQLEECVPLKLSLMLTVKVIIGNLFLHILAMYFYQHFAIFKRLTPSFLKFDNNKVPLRPVMTVENEYADHLKRQHINNMAVLTKQQLSQLKPALSRKPSIKSTYNRPTTTISRRPSNTSINTQKDDTVTINDESEI